LIIGTGTATFLAIVYAFAIHYIPFVYLNLLMTLGMGMVVGWVVSREAKGSRIRHGILPALIGFACGFSGLYVAWAADLIARIGVPQGQSPLVGLDPRVMASYMTVFYENGLWTIGKNGNAVSGLPLLAIWLLEAGVIVGLAGLVPWSDFKQNVYCEACDQWTRSEKDVARLQETGGDDLPGRILAGNIAALGDVPRAPPDAMQFLRVNVWCCETCTGTNALELERVTIKLDKENKPSEKTASLISRLLISDADVELVRDAGRAGEPQPESEVDVEIVQNADPPHVEAEPG
jgi:hypothetical protein